MSTLDLSEDSTRRPQDVVTDVDLSEDALALLPASDNTFAFIHALCDAELYDQAFLVLARALPRQYAIIWATRCLEEIAGAAPEGAESECLGVVQKWLRGPDEKLRRAAMEAADAAEYQGAYAWLAASVGFSGGSLAPANQVEVPPPAYLTAVALSACLMTLAAAQGEQLDECARDIVERGLAMAAVPGA